MNGSFLHKAAIDLPPFAIAALMLVVGSGVEWSGVEWSGVEYRTRLELCRLI